MFWDNGIVNGSYNRSLLSNKIKWIKFALFKDNFLGTLCFSTLNLKFEEWWSWNLASSPWMAGCRVAEVGYWIDAWNLEECKLWNWAYLFLLFSVSECFSSKNSHISKNILIMGKDCFISVGLFLMLYLHLSKYCRLNCFATTKNTHTDRHLHSCQINLRVTNKCPSLYL